MFPLASPRKTSRVSEKQNSLFPLRTHCFPCLIVWGIRRITPKFWQEDPCAASSTAEKTPRFDVPLVWSRTSLVIQMFATRLKKLRKNLRVTDWKDNVNFKRASLIENRLHVRQMKEKKKEKKKVGRKKVSYLLYKVNSCRCGHAESFGTMLSLIPGKYWTIERTTWFVD